jgi:hypothetical protein
MYVQSKVSNFSLVGFVLSMYGLWQVLVQFPLGIAAVTNVYPHHLSRAGARAGWNVVD